MHPLLWAGLAAGGYYLYDQRQKAAVKKPSGGPAGYAPVKPALPGEVVTSEGVWDDSWVEVGASLLPINEDKIKSILGVSFLAAYPEMPDAYLFKTSSGVMTDMPVPVISAAIFTSLVPQLNAAFPRWEAEWLRPGVIVFVPDWQPVDAAPALPAPRPARRRNGRG